MFDEITAIVDQKTRIDKYKEVQAAFFQGAQVDQLKALIDHSARSARHMRPRPSTRPRIRRRRSELAARTALHAACRRGPRSSRARSVRTVASEDMSVIISRQVLAEFVALLAPPTGGPALEPSLVKDVAVYALERLQPRVVSFEEQVTVIRERLAAIFEAEENWALAARTLAAIPLDSGNRVLDDDYKVRKYVHIAQLYLEIDDPVQAEAYINRASLIITPETEAGLRLRHKVCYARILDSKRKFLEAAVRYYQLSQVAHLELGGSKVDESELLKALTAAVTCAILAPAGPQRSRFLATLYKDERSSKLGIFSVLEKTFMERVLERHEVVSFAQTLAPHQMAKLDDGARARARRLRTAPRTTAARSA